MNSAILSFGEALWDLLPTAPALGGAPLNFAYRLNSLGHRSIIVSRLGNALGAMVAQQEGATQPISYKESLAFMETGCPGIVDRQLADYLQYRISKIRIQNLTDMRLFKILAKGANKNDNNTGSNQTSGTDGQR